MARLVGHTYRITVPAPPGFHDVALTCVVIPRFGVVETPVQLEQLLGQSGDYVRGYCAGRAWALEIVSVWEPELVP